NWFDITNWLWYIKKKK
nr:Chain P, Fragment of HIV glycoprotein (GP41) [synthetic construct]4WY7_P Chain P, Envelope glycoprotein gp160 [Human immunodeficiency virus type 1 (WMJ2 ISOLATE)]4XAW_P Chain P, FRAGMENT OF HIV GLYCOPROTEIN (GP41) including the MPER region 671-683 [Human immunodeficiency virus 1]5CIL_P Chain P, Peptide from the MPER region of the ENV protein of HIV-1 [Human immunodeficiency virus 1]5CIN_P Chain P, Peptide from MPER region of HIV-1 ENV [Human immunodeficiency virus 1]5X08_P Chain P, Envelope